MTNHKPIRWGIIGCGDVCEIKSGPAFQKVEGSELVAVMRRDLDKARDFAERHNVPRYYDNADALIADEDVDAVYVATPPNTHKEYALKVAAAGKICCVEKPMAMNFQECQEMIQVFNRANLPLFVAFYRRSLPRFLQVKSWLDENKIGKIEHLQYTLRCPHRTEDLSQDGSWRTKPDIAGGGYFIDLACHDFDLFTFFLGDITTAHGITSNQHGVYAAEDSVTAAWCFKSGVTGCGAWHFGAKDNVEKAEIYGSKGKITFSLFEENPIYLETDDESIELVIEHPENIQYFHVQDMIKHINGDIIHPSLGLTGAHASWVIDEIYKT